MGTRLSKLKSAMTDLEDFLKELKDKGTAINEHETAHFQKLEQMVTKLWESLNNKWEELEDVDKNF